MNKKKLFGVLTAASMILNSGVAVFAEEMVEASGVVGAVTNPDGSVAINAQNFPDENLLNAVKAASQNQENPTDDATKVVSLTVPTNVENLSGLQYLTGLTSLNISGNSNLSSLDLSANSALNTLTVSNNPGLVAITLPTTEELSTVTITGNKSLTELDLTPASLATTANLFDNGLAKLTVTNNLHLLSLDVHGNVLYALDTTGCRHLVDICAAGNRIYEIDITSRAVKNLNLAGNKLTSLDVSEMVNMLTLNVADNMLESIQLPEENNLTYFNCDQNHLASLDLSGAMQESSEISETTAGNGVTVITGTQTLFAGTKDKAIDLKAYDANFEPSKTDLYDLATGKTTGKSINRNGIADLASTEVDMPEEPGTTPGGPGTNPGGPTVTPSDSVTLTDKNTTVTLTEEETSNTTTTIPTTTSQAPLIQPSNLQIVWDPNATPPAPYALGIQVLDSSFQPTGEWKYIAWNSTNIENAKFNSDNSATTGFTITATGMNALGGTDGLDVATNGTTYGNLKASDNAAATFTTVKIIPGTVLTNKIGRVLATYNADGEGTFSSLQAKEGNNWITITDDESIITDDEIVKGTVTDGTQAPDSVKDLTIADPGTNLYKIAPYILDAQKSADIPVVNAQEVATTLTPAITRVIYTESSGAVAKFKVQVQQGSNWITLEAASAPTGTIFTYTPSNKELKYTTSNTSDPKLWAQGYTLPKAGSITLTAANAIAQKTLDATNLRILYVLGGEDGKTPVVQKVQVWTGTGAVNFTSATDWTDVAANTDEAYAMFVFDDTTFTAPTSAGTAGSLDIEKSTVALPEEYVPIATTVNSVKAYPMEATTTTTYKLTKVTIDNNGTPIEITDEKSLANFTVSDVKPATEEGASATATLAYTSTADADFKKQYPIEGDSSITVNATITSGTTTGGDTTGTDQKEEMVEVMTEATANASTTSVLNPAPVALAYDYDTDADVNGDQMLVKVYKEDLMNRLYNPNSGEHFYTKDNHEKDVLVSLGWQYEGTGWVAPNGVAAVNPVYRLYNANAGDHHYTEDANEKDTLVRIGWSFEGVGWYSAADPVYYNVTGEMTGNNGNRTIDVFREYNPNAKAAGAHNYTISENENAVLVSLGWIDEGIAWNALK